MIRSFAFFRSALAMAVATSATLLVVFVSAAPAGASTSEARTAASTSEARTAAIATSGIDLASAVGAARIAAEIDRAAHRVCSTGDDRAPAAVMARQSCIKAALAAALPRLDRLAASALVARTAVADAAPTTTIAR